MTSVVLTILVLSTGLISAFLLILLNRNQAPAKKASTLACPVNGAYCQWDGPEGLTYTVEITTSSGEKIPLGPRSGNKQYFTSQVGTTYRCVVTASNSCGSARTQSADTTCRGDGPTPITIQKLTPTTTTNLISSPTPTKAGPTATPPPGASLTPTPIQTVLSGTPTATKTPTPTISSSPTGTGGSAIAGSPTPTTILIVAATNTPGPSATATPTSSASAQNPTTSSGSSSSLPQAGTIIPSLAILGFAIFIIALGFVL